MSKPTKNDAPKTESTQGKRNKRIDNYLSY